MDARTFFRRARRGLNPIVDAASRCLPDRVIYARTYRRNFGRRLDLRNPRTLNEKIYWLMLYYRRPILTRLADKYEVRGYVAERIGEKYLSELYGVWEDPAAIDFDRLPDTFVLKVAGGEKMFWLMLYDRRPILTRVADKYTARGYVAERLGPEYLIELHGLWDDPADIDFERLPPTFVLKISNGFAMNIYCRDRATFDRDAARRQLAGWLRRSHYSNFREWAYKDARSRIMAEELLVDRRLGTPSDYKIMCFNGEPRFIEVHTDRHADHRRDIVDLEWRPLPFKINVHLFPAHDVIPPPPENLDQLIKCAGRLAEGLPLLRVDFFSLEGRRILLGELTVYPAAGQTHFTPESYDGYWGDVLPLPVAYRP